MTGKTEIAKALAERLDVPYFKASSEHQTYLEKQRLFIQQLRHADPRLIDFLRQTGYSIVMDRGFPCEFVYSQVMGRNTDGAMLSFIDREYASLNTRIVVCYRSSYDGLVDDIDSKIDGDLLGRLDTGYRAFADWTNCKVMFLNVDDEDLDREVGDVLDWIVETT